jgi:hypothetical protein
MPLSPTPLPYLDTKPVGAADFYFAINATFRFLLNRFGLEGLRRYWIDLGSRYFAPVSQRWKAGGLPAVADYWQAFFDAEPGAEVNVSQSPDTVILDVRVCPAIKHLRDHGREIMPHFCEHCSVMGQAMAAPAGLTLRVEGGSGSCRQFFSKNNSTPNPEVSC